MLIPFTDDTWYAKVFNLIEHDKFYHRLIISFKIYDTCLLNVNSLLLLVIVEFKSAKDKIVINAGNKIEWKF